MNYIEQINGFWDKVATEEKMKPSAIAVYMALLQINNKCGWKPVFKVDYGQVLYMTGLTKNTYYAAVEFLDLSGYVEYKKGPNQYHSAEFSIKMLYQKMGKHRESIGKASGKQVVLHEESTGNIPKQVNKETIKTELVVEVEQAQMSNEEHLEYEEKKMQEVWNDKAPPEEKEKSSAQKEKDWPVWTEILPGVQLCSYYTNSARLLQGKTDNRSEEFEWFWEQKKDEYIVRHKFPDMPEIAKHFYHWFEIRLTKKRNSPTPTNYKNGATKNGSNNRQPIATNWDAKP